MFRLWNAVDLSVLTVSSDCAPSTADWDDWLQLVGGVTWGLLTVLCPMPTLFASGTNVPEVA